MANFTQLEQILSDTLDEWALKGQGVVLTKKNPLLFMQMLRTHGLEIIKLGDIQKVRHEHKVITGEIIQAYRLLTAAKQRLEMLETEKEIIKEESNES